MAKYPQIQSTTINGRIPGAIELRIDCKVVVYVLVTNLIGVDTVTYVAASPPIMNNPRILAPVMIILTNPDFSIFSANEYPNV